MSSETLSMAQQHIERARMEECPTGNPLVAARNYLSAMEYIQSAAVDMASTITSSKERDFFLYQVKGRLMVYDERVRLLLGAASEMGLDDVPEVTAGGMKGLFKTTSMPTETTPDLDELFKNLEIATNGTERKGTLDHA